MWPGDHFSDMNTLMSGENFATHGLIRLRFLPVHYIGAMTDPPSYYTHYPPLPNVINGFMQLAGIRGLAATRVLCGLLGVVGLICMYRAFVPDIGPFAAVCGLGFIASSSYFFTYGVSLHQHTYNLLFMGLFFSLLTRAVRSERHAFGLWAGCWIVLMLESLSSFEFIMYPQVFAWVYVIVKRRLGRCWPMLLVLTAAPLIGLALHLLQNIWALGWSGAMADVNEAFGKASGATGRGRWAMVKRVPAALLNHSRLCYASPWPALPVLGGAWAMWVGRRDPDRSARRRIGAPIAAALAGALPWYILMPSHAATHAHTASQILPLTFIVMGGVVSLLLGWIAKPDLTTLKRISAALGLLVIVIAQGMVLRERQNRVERSGVSIRYLFEGMGDAALPDKAAVLTNTPFEAQLAYHIRRPLWRTPTRRIPFCEQTLTSLRERLPDDWTLEHYLFVAPGDPQLVRFLAPVCPGRMLRLPGDARCYVILFDLTYATAPLEQRQMLAPDRQKAQLAGKFPPWRIPGFRERVHKARIEDGKAKIARRPRR